MASLVGFSKIISRTNDAVIEYIERRMLRKTACIQVDGMGYIPSQEQHTYEVSSLVHHCVIPSDANAP